MDFLNKLEQYITDITSRMNPADKETGVAAIEKAAGAVLPESFKALYEQYDGERNAPYTGLILGFSLMDTADILETMKSFKENDFSEITSLTTGKISDEKMCDRIMVPFAWDGSRGYFCMDFSPDTEGKKGQVVALDYDFDECILVADSMDEFFEFVLRMLTEKKCYTAWEESEDEKYFTFETGHFFNVMKELLKEESGDLTEIELPEEFWRQYYEGDKVSADELRTQKKLMISKGEMTISLLPVAYMSGLRELIIHNCTIRDFESICGATELKTLILTNCTFDYKELSRLSELPKLKEIRLIRMPLTDISCLKDVKSLRILDLSKLSELDTTQLGLFTKLQELVLEHITIESLEFLNGYKSLKVLEFNKVNVKNLDFLKYLKKLTKFKLRDKAEDESGLKYLKDLPNLKEFDYPVSDMAIYEGCEKLEQIGIDATGFKNPEVLKDSGIVGVMVSHADSEEEAEQVIEKVKEQVKLYSYGMTGSFLG